MGFSIWHPFEKQTLEKVPQEIGVYVFRKAGAQFFGRLNGNSDILYIGSTEKDLRHRLQQYLSPGPSQWTNKRIHEYAKKNSIEVAWLLCDEPKNFEHDLLKQYLLEHSELPPLNASDIRQLLKPVKDEVHLTDKASVIKK